MPSRKRAGPSGFMGALRGQRLCSCRAPSSLNPSILTISRLHRVTYPSLLHSRHCKVIGGELLPYYHSPFMCQSGGETKPIIYGTNICYIKNRMKHLIYVTTCVPLFTLWPVPSPCRHEKLNIQSMRRGREEHDWQARDHKCSTTAQNGNRTL